MIIDANIFVGDSLYRNSLTEDQLLSSMKRFGLDKVVVRPLKPTDYSFDNANHRISELQQRHSDIIGFCRVNPWDKTAVDDLEKAIKEYSLNGVHLHPWEENFMINDPVVYEVLDSAADLSIPVYVNVGYPIVSEPLQLLEIARKFEKVTFLCTHGGNLDISGLSFDDALILASDTENVKFDISGVYRRDFIELLINKVGSENVLFGSNTPYMDIGLEIERINAADIDSQIKHKIFYQNICDLLSI